jgi:hypothetical protein
MIDDTKHLKVDAVLILITALDNLLLLDLVIGAEAATVSTVIMITTTDRPILVDNTVIEAAVLPMDANEQGEEKWQTGQGGRI